MTLSRATASCLMGIFLACSSLAVSTLGQNFAPQQNPQAAQPQQNANPQPYGPPQAVSAPQAPTAAPQLLPCPFPPLTQREEAYLSDVLKYWEERSNKVNRFESKFIRWEYDTKWGPQDPNVAKTISYGEIKYEKPDKGMFHVERITHYVPPQGDQNQAEGAQYGEREGEVGEHWVCDGKSVFVYDAPQKQLLQAMLPAELQGQGIVNGPLPFLFGAKAEKIKQRYWTRMILPPPVKGQYWMEAYPKLREDRAQYQKVLVILDEAEYLPIAVQIFDRTYNRITNPSRVSFEFQDRIENPNLTLQKFNLFHRAFFEPKLPSGWKKVVEQLPASGARMAEGPTANTPR